MPPAIADSVRIEHGATIMPRVGNVTRDRLAENGQLVAPLGRCQGDVLRERVPHHPDGRGRYRALSVRCAVLLRSCW